MQDRLNAVRERPFLSVSVFLAIVAIVFSSYVALDHDLRTLVWKKWKGDVPYAFPGGGRQISIDLDINVEEQVEPADGSAPAEIAPADGVEGDALPGLAPPEESEPEAELEEPSPEPLPEASAPGAE